MPRRKQSRPVKVANGGGSITLRSDGRWMGRYTTRDPETGESLRPTVYGASEQECRARLVAALDARNDGTEIVSRGRAKSVEDVYRAWLADLNELVEQGARSPRTVSRYQEIGDAYVVPTIGKKAVKTLQPGDVESVMKAVGKRGRSPRTINYSRATMGSLLTFAKQQGWVNRNVAEMTKPRPENQRREVKPLKPADLTVVLADALDDPEGRLHVVSVALGTRQSETLGLCWDQHVDDLDDDAPQVHIRRSLQWNQDTKSFFVREINKTMKSRRDVYLPDVAIEALRRQKQHQREARLAAGPKWSTEFGDLVFSGPAGEPLKRDHVSKGWARKLKTLNIAHTGFHGGTRHGAASLLNAEGASMVEISRSLGHSSIAVTADLYTSVFDEGKKRIASAMDRALRKP